MTVLLGRLSFLIGQGGQKCKRWENIKVEQSIFEILGRKVEHPTPCFLLLSILPEGHWEPHNKSHLLTQAPEPNFGEPTPMFSMLWEILDGVECILLKLNYLLLIHHSYCRLLTKY